MDGDAAEAGWRPLLWAGGAAAVLTAMLIPLQVAAFAAWPPPLGAPAEDWFDLFQRRPLVAFLAMDALLLVDYLLLVPIVLALYVVLRPAAPSVMLLAAALFFVAIAAYVASNTMVEVWSLAQRHAAAEDGTERAALVAAGEAALAQYQGTAFHVSYLVGSLAGLLVMLPVLLGRSAAFGRPTAAFAVAGNALGLGLYLPRVGVVVAAASGVVLWFWYILLARRLLRLARAAPGEA